MGVGEMAKSMRQAFIRVSEINESKEYGRVIYGATDIEEVLKQWAETAGITYWFIEHEADSEVSLTHWHIVIKFKTPTPFANIKSKFPLGYIINAGSLKGSIQYLVHLTDKSKKQYPWEKIVTNCTDMTPYKVQTSSQDEVTIRTITDRINKGEIRQYNQFTEIPIEIWAKYKSRIENALVYYIERVCMDKHRDINVIFISGETGLGKTTFAKTYCEGTKKSCCVSSSSNDPLQDYKGEDVLILDDLRDSDFKLTDLLKVLDNHTKSTVKSRYHNKAFIGDTIIITSFKPLSDWYFNMSKADKEQLYRRVRSQYKFYPDRIEAFQYNDVSRKYEPLAVSPNYVTMKAQQKKEMVLNVFKAVGLEFKVLSQKEIEKAMENATEEKELADEISGWFKKPEEKGKKIKS